MNCVIQKDAARRSGTVMVGASELHVTRVVVIFNAKTKCGKNSADHDQLARRSATEGRFTTPRDKQTP